MRGRGFLKVHNNRIEQSAEQGTADGIMKKPKQNTYNEKKRKRKEDIFVINHFTFTQINKLADRMKFFILNSQFLLSPHRNHDHNRHCQYHIISYHSMT